MLLLNGVRVGFGGSFFLGQCEVLEGGLGLGGWMD